MDKISLPALSPKLEQSPEFGAMMNADAVIALVQKTATPQARRIYRVFRRRLAELEREGAAEQTPEERRSSALIGAFAECGVHMVEAGR